LYFTKRSGRWCKIISYFRALDNPSHNNDLKDFGMYLSPEKKSEIFKEHGKSVTDTGSTEGQIALFTYRINHLTGHLKKNHKDFSTEKALVDLVGKRKKLLSYLKEKDILRYRAILEKLNLRK
jgi:small subunit ribosomal protein S15